MHVLPQLLRFALAVRAVRLWPEFGFRFEPLALLFRADQAVLEITAERRPFGGFIPLRQPIAERIAEPWRLRTQGLESKFVPDLLGALHVFLLRQGQWRHVALHGRVHQKRRILFLIVLALGPMALAAMRHHSQILDR